MQVFALIFKILMWLAISQSFAPCMRPPNQRGVQKKYMNIVLTERWVVRVEEAPG